MNQYNLGLSMAALIFFVGAGCATYEDTEGRIAKGTPERILLRTEGPPGQSFSAVLIVDGSRREISGVTPTEFPMECRLLVGEMKRVDGDGEFSFAIERHDGTGRFYTPPVKDLVSFRYHSGVLEVLTKNGNGFGR